MKFTVHNTPKPKSCPEVMETLLTALTEAREKDIQFLAISYITFDGTENEITADCYLSPRAIVDQCEDAMDMMVKRVEDDIDGVYETGE